MTLPEALRQALAGLLDEAKPSAVASRHLTDAYKGGERRQSAKALPAKALRQPAMRGHDERLAYLAVRMPATYAACRHALNEASERIPGFVPRTLLDLGAGPGTASWAATSTFSSLESITLAERDTSLIALGQRLITTSAPAPLRQAKWLQMDLTSTTQNAFAPPSLATPASATPESSSPHASQASLTARLSATVDGYDLVISSYIFNELGEKAALRLLDRAWQATRQTLILVEPGSRTGFAIIEACRQRLIAAEAFLAAPCPHALTCPAAAAGDWCHFAARLERSSLHRRLKGAVQGFEDEKFSYLIATRLPCQPVESRILRHPLRRSGHLQLTLCTSSGVTTQTIGRSATDTYRRARKAAWGDGWSQQTTLPEHES